MGRRLEVRQRGDGEETMEQRVDWGIPRKPLQPFQWALDSKAREQTLEWGM